MGDSKVKVAVRVRPMNRRGETPPSSSASPSPVLPGSGAGRGCRSLGTGVGRDRCVPVRVDRCVSVCASLFTRNKQSPARHRRLVRPQPRCAHPPLPITLFPNLFGFWIYFVSSSPLGNSPLCTCFTVGSCWDSASFFLLCGFGGKCLFFCILPRANSPRCSPALGA